MPFLRGLFLEGLLYGAKFTFQSRLGKLIVGKTFTVFALFYFVCEGNFQVCALGGGGGLIFEGAIEGRSFCVTGLLGLYLEGLIFGILRLGASSCLPATLQTSVEHRSLLTYP